MVNFDDVKDDKDIENLTVEELLFLYKYRKVDSFEVLLKKYTPLITKFTRIYFINGYDKDDLTQEAHIVFHRSLEKFDTEKGYTIGQYYKTALKNEFKSLLRKDETEKRLINKRTHSLEQMMENGMPLCSGVLENRQYSPEEHVILNEDVREYELTLSKFEKKIYDLYSQKKHKKEIAKLLDISEVSVGNAIDRCRKKLKDEFKKNSF